VEEPVAETPALPTRPLLKPWYRLSTSVAGTVLRYGGSVLELEGRAATELLPHLLPLLDGTRTLDEIASRLGEPVRPAIEHALGVLAERGLVTEPLPTGVPAETARTIEFLTATDDYGRSESEVVASLARATVKVVGSSPVARAISTTLEGAGLRSAEPAGWEGGGASAADLAIVAPDETEVPRLEAWNHSALEQGTTWLQVLPFDGLLAAVGPIYVPAESACYECYQLRRSANIGPVPDTAFGRYPGAPSLDAVLTGLAVTIALRFLALGDGLSVGVLVAVGATREISWSRHVLYRVPRCPACARSATEATPAPWQGASDRAA
jgi:bacteriocin biosynthesis cyclodehydratase domain-containing protein